MAGVTDAPFRYIARKYGATHTISEMITSQINLWGTDKTKHRLKDDFNNGDALNIMQIVGASSDVVVDAARKCVEYGADIVEVNMGCPAKKVCNVLAGSALLKNEFLVAEILTNVVKSVEIPVFLKTRLGFDKNQQNILNVAKIAEDSGIQSLTIHGRTRCELYNGEASYDLIAKVKSQAKIPVFANGDINTPEKAKYVLDFTQADGLYIGRGALGRPWVFSQIAQYLATGDYTTPTVEVMAGTVLEHLSYIYLHYGDQMGVRLARKHIKWYAQSNVALNFMQQHLPFVNQIESSKEQYQKIAELFYN